MQIKSPLQMNDWEISEFFKVILIIQIAVFATIGLDSIGLQIPILREFTTFIYVMFVPGILILRILRLHKLGNIETLLYMVGLSIASTMFIGFLMNMIYPLVGISKPISLTPIIISISAFVLLLCVLSYLRDREFSNPSFVDVNYILSPQFLLLSLVPFLAIFGTYLMNFYRSPIISMISIMIIGLIVILIAFNKISKSFYPFTIFIIAISLLYHSTLISMQIWGWDIQIEYYLADLVIKNSYWDFNIAIDYNSMLSVVMFAPIFAKISGMALTWIFKIIYPLIFSLVPLGLYRIYQKQTSAKIAFLACFFFVAFFSFYMELPTLVRQQIAELFIVLLVMLMFTKIDRTKRDVLFIFFIMSLVMSHYSLTYLYLLFITGTLIILFLAKNLKIRNFYHKITKTRESENSDSFKMFDVTSNLPLLIFSIAFALLWYISTSDGKTFDASFRSFLNLIFRLLERLNFIIYKIGTLPQYIGTHLLETIIIVILIGIIILFLKYDKNRFKIQTSRFKKIKKEKFVLVIFFALLPLLLYLKPKYLVYLDGIAVYFISVGIIITILKYVKNKFTIEYTLFSVLSLFILLLALISPSFAGSLNLSRMYQFVFIFLAPFCVIGGIRIYELIFNVINVTKSDQNTKNSLELFSTFLVILLFFNTTLMDKFRPDMSDIDKIIIAFLAPFGLTGFIKIMKLISNFDRFKFKKSGSGVFKVFIIIVTIFLLFNTGFVQQVVNADIGAFPIHSFSEAPLFNDQEFYSAKWLGETKAPLRIYADRYGQLLMVRFLGKWSDERNIVFNFNEKIPSLQDFYIYVRTFNIKNNALLIYRKDSKGNDVFDSIPLDDAIKFKNRIYDNGGSWIYR